MFPSQKITYTSSIPSNHFATPKNIPRPPLAANQTQSVPFTIYRTHSQSIFYPYAPVNHTSMLQTIRSPIGGQSIQPTHINRQPIRITTNQNQMLLGQHMRTGSHGHNFSMVFPVQQTQRGTPQMFYSPRNAFMVSTPMHYQENVKLGQIGQSGPILYKSTNFIPQYALKKESRPEEDIHSLYDDSPKIEETKCISDEISEELPEKNQQIKEEEVIHQPTQVIPQINQKVKDVLTDFLNENTTKPTQNSKPDDPEIIIINQNPTKNNFPSISIQPPSSTTVKKRSSFSTQDRKNISTFLAAQGSVLPQIDSEATQKAIAIFGHAFKKHVGEDPSMKNISEIPDIPQDLPNPDTAKVGEELLNQINYMMVFHSKSITQLEAIEDSPDYKRVGLNVTHKVTMEEEEYEQKHKKSSITHPDFPLLQDIPYAMDFVKIYDSLKGTGKNFVDPEFPPNENSLYEKENSIKKDKWKDYVWMRPTEFFPNGYAVFSYQQSSHNEKTLKTLLRKSRTMAAIDKDDIVQGALGDCYFLSSLASLAQNPARIRGLFISTKMNEEGVYCLRMCHEGIWRAVIVDDYFPCLGDRSGPAFSQSKPGENELWVLLLEKAWAKLYGNYERIEAGLTRDVLGDLTGAPTKIIWTDDPTIWDEMLNAFKKNYLLTAGAADEGQMEKYFQGKGMVTGHAYSLMGCYEILKEKLVKLRNPWGCGEWQGPWGDSDPIWNALSEEEKDEVGYVNKDDGSFFMSLEMFKSIYSDMQICMVNDDYQYQAFELTVKKKETVYLEIVVDEEGEYFFTILQRSLRKMADTPKYDISKGTMVLAKVNGENLEFEGALTKTHREVFVGKVLTKGTYICSCKVDWCWAKEGTFVFTSYGENVVKVRILPKVEGFLEKAYSSRVLKAKNKEKLTGVNAERIVEVFPIEGYGYYFVGNMENKPIEVNLTWKNKEEEIKPKKNQLNGKKNKLELGPLEGHIMMLRVKNVKDLKPDFEEKAIFL